MKNKLIEDAKKLIDNLSVIEDRHLLELLAVHSGLKKVMRIHIANDKEYALLSDFCKHNTLHLAHSQFRLKLSWANEIGDQFYNDVPWEDESAEEFIAYLTKEDLDGLSRSIYIEREGSHEDAGRLYGYPHCCCENYELISNGEEWVKVLSDNSQGTFFSPWGNKLAYLVHGFTLFPDYFPCSYNCKATVELSKEYFQLGVKVGLTDFVHMQLEFMRRVYLVGPEGVLSFSDWNIDSKNRLQLRLEKMSFFGKNILEEYPEDVLEILLPESNKASCIWDWKEYSYRVFVFTDD
jgi:hypothetical protein